MKTFHSIFGALALAALVGSPALAQEQADQKADQQSNSHSSSSSSQNSESKSVTVTSDGNRTIKKTVIVRNGVKEVITEITDENGNTTTTRSGGNENPGGEEGAAQDGPWLGIRVKEVSETFRSQLGLPADQGVEIDAVAPDSPAAKAGIRKGDLLLSLNEAAVGSAEELAKILSHFEAGETVELEILRQGKRETVEVTLAERPPAADQPPAPPAGGGNQGNPGGDAQMKVEINGAEFDQILNDPNVPEDFKEMVRDMKRKMEEFQRNNLPAQP